MTHTFQTVSDLVRENWESDLPDKVLECLRPLHGKTVTARILDKLPGGKDKWVLDRNYGMTHIKTRDYWDSHGARGVSLILAWTTATFPLDVDLMVEKNPAYYSARFERNHARMEASHDKALLDRMAATMNRIERAKAELQAAFADFDKLTEYGAPFSADRYDLERACGMRVTPRGSGETRIQLS